jgi:glyoxylase-like metal-dependent hydrolase (beta-lactamase superfamily II)
MTELNRRGLLRCASAAGAAFTLSPVSALTLAHAAAPLSGKQAPGFYRYKVGSIEVTVVTDGARTGPLTDAYIRNAKKDEVADALDASFMGRNAVTSQFTPVVVNTGGKLVVIDTGWGEAQLGPSKGAIGQFNTNLAAAGIDRNAVDTVIISHCHGDHLNGLLTADNKLAFPNAEILMPATDWRFWTDPGTASRLPAGTTAEIQYKNNRRVLSALNNKVTLYEADKEIVPGITSVATYGHTPGHMSHIVSSGSSKVFVQADVANGPLFARNPGWHSMFDMDGPVAEATRRRTYDMLAAEKMMLQGFHYPFPSVGYIEKAGTGYRVVPIAWSPVI